jgi:hypothetical protein
MLGQTDGDPLYLQRRMEADSHESTIIIILLGLGIGALFCGKIKICKLVITRLMNVFF